jgi:hypothetical protein
MRSGKTKVLPLDLVVYRNPEIEERIYKSIDRLFKA